MIAVDWGGSNLRAYRLDDHGRVLGQRRGEVGALACDGQHAQTLAGVIGDWDDPLVLLCGMVGARGGWIEVPYVPCPAGIATLAAGMVELGTHAGDALRGRRLWCVPGMADHRGAAADVMRGEETQVAGLLAQLGPGRHDVCLPGTHSKWVRVEDGAITGISTALTGELYGLLRRHSILARSMPATEPPLDPAAFDAGLAAARAGGGLLHDLFGVRTAALFARFEAEALPSYLSGLLVGHELQPALAGAADGPAHLVGSDALLERYARALSAHGRTVQRHREDLAALGLYRLARARFG
ncbi:2-dehydro-3-deoxygalactonokinase [Pseudoxanthomonas sp. SGNA-20]|uniref:2-dehydro-3-deoxygalactonokinase n=1 Tax=Pseudoxanthomonas taiwanensis J19 TaxID=935569 RepID=A0A562DL83_9GAMM|nr:MULTISPECIES: 2-dehydro-3-deoxygalactonokinase [Pseudoxanthomonas]RRN58485.1 2-dehydro-3-deoxygalactonokinase [Pseudoxanthomonas sp. SGNA-20]TWH10438.1 2-dehydro-3-deoxygalactonokinase [Pseudoxanthomonas taiwanensis J19]